MAPQPEESRANWVYVSDKQFELTLKRASERVRKWTGGDVRSESTVSSQGNRQSQCSGDKSQKS